MERINRDLNRVNREPDLINKLSELGFTPITATVAESQAEAARQSIVWPPLIKKLNLQAGN